MYIKKHIPRHKFFYLITINIPQLFLEKKAIVGNFISSQKQSSVKKLSPVIKALFLLFHC
jgi:hypothetical protein